MIVLPSPLGRYSDASAAIVAVVLVLSAVAVHIAVAITNGHADTSWLDASAGVAVGVVLGQRQTTNGAGKIAAAAHARIDELTAQLNARQSPGEPPIVTTPTTTPDTGAGS